MGSWSSYVRGMWIMHEREDFCVLGAYIDSLHVS